MLCFDFTFHKNGNSTEFNSNWKCLYCSLPRTQCITISLFGPKVNFMFNILQQLLIKSSFVEAEHEKKRQIEKQEKNLLLKTTVNID